METNPSKRQKETLKSDHSATYTITIYQGSDTESEPIWDEWTFSMESLYERMQGLRIKGNIFTGEYHFAVNLADVWNDLVVYEKAECKHTITGICHESKFGDVFERTCEFTVIGRIVDHSS